MAFQSPDLSILSNQLGSGENKRSGHKDFKHRQIVE